jgi:glucose-fructose oxidoreductase
MKTPRSSTPVSRRTFLGQLSTAAAAALALAPRRLRADDAQRPPKGYGVALVGLGNYSATRLGPALKLTDHCHVAGVVTGDPKKGREWSRHYGFSDKNVYGYETMGQMAGNPDIDIVYVVTPNALHARHCIAAAKAGKHVICEKPMATSVADCDAIIAACRAANVRLFVGYRLHYEPHNIELARLAREGTFGPFMRIAGENGFDMGSPDAADRNWRVNKKLAGGGPLMDMGIYVIQAACMVKVEAAPVSVTAKFGPVTRPEVFSEVEQSLNWTMEFADSASAKCFTSYADQVSHFRADADGGWAEIEDPAFYYEEPILRTSRGTPNLPKVNHQVAQLNGMAVELMSGRPTIASGEMGRRDIAIVEAIYAAAASGKRADVNA